MTHEDWVGRFQETIAAEGWSCRPAAGDGALVLRGQAEGVPLRVRIALRADGQAGLEQAVGVVPRPVSPFLYSLTATWAKGSPVRAELRPREREVEVALRSEVDPGEDGAPVLARARDLAREKTALNACLTRLRREGRTATSRLAAPAGTAARSAADGAAPEDTKRCPHCEAEIRAAAVKCPACRQFLQDIPGRAPAPGLVEGARGARLGARLLDGLFVVLPCLVVYLAGFLMVINRIAHQPLRPTVRDLQSEFALIGALGLLLSLGVLACQWILISLYGASLGKGYLGLRIVQKDGSSVGFLRGVVLREWVPGMASLVPFGGLLALGDVLCIFGEPRRCAHDYLAGTRVVDAALRVGFCPRCQAETALGPTGRCRLCMKPIAAADNRDEFTAILASVRRPLELMGLAVGILLVANLSMVFLGPKLSLVLFVVVGIPVGGKYLMNHAAG